MNKARLKKMGALAWPVLWRAAALAPLAAALAFALHAAWRGVWVPLQLIVLALAVRWALLALQGGLGALLWPLALIVRGSAGRSSKRSP